MEAEGAGLFTHRIEGQAFLKAMRGGTTVPRYACQPWALRTAIIVPRMSFQV